MLRATGHARMVKDIRTATELQHRVESAAANIGLFVNVDKTNVMTLYIEEQVGDLLSRSGGISIRSRRLELAAAGHFI